MKMNDGHLDGDEFQLYTKNKEEKEEKKEKEENEENEEKEEIEEKVTVFEVIFGITLMLISGVMYSGLAALVKWGSNLGFSAPEILFYRATIQIFLCLFSSLFTIKLQPVFSCKCNISDMKQSILSVGNGGNLLILAIIGRGIFGAFSTLTYFEGAVLLPIGDCVTLKALVTVLTSYIAWILFNESITRKHFVALILCLFGVICITQPPMIFTGTLSTDKANNHDNTQYYGYLIAISSSFCQCVVYICIKYAKKSAVFILILSQGIFSMIVGIVFVFIFKEKFHFFPSTFGMEYICIFCIGIIGFVAQWTLTKGGQLIMSGVASMLRCTDIFWCFLWQILIFNNTPNNVDWLGAVSMFSSVILISLEKINKAKKEHEKQLKANINKLPHKLSISEHILLLADNDDNRRKSTIFDRIYDNYYIDTTPTTDYSESLMYAEAVDNYQESEQAVSALSGLSGSNLSNINLKSLKV